MQAVEGIFAKASSWPDWEINGGLLPHPVVIFGVIDKNVLVIPITESCDLCSKNLLIEKPSKDNEGGRQKINYTSVFPPLSMRCCICLESSEGDFYFSNVLEAEWRNDDLYHNDKLLIKLKDHKIMDRREWAKLRSYIKILLAVDTAALKAKAASNSSPKKSFRR